MNGKDMMAPGNLLRMLSVAGLAMLVAACAAGPPPPPLMSPLAETGQYGYTDQQVSDRRFEVTYIGPVVVTGSTRASRQADAVAAKELAHDLALWRSAEIAGASGAAAFVVEDEDTETEILTSLGYYPSFHYYHFGYRRRYGRHLFYDPFYYHTYRRTTLQARVDLAIRLTDDPNEESTNAAETIARLSAKHPTARGAPPPPP